MVATVIRPKAKQRKAPTKPAKGISSPPAARPAEGERAQPSRQPAASHRHPPSARPQLEPQQASSADLGPEVPAANTPATLTPSQAEAFNEVVRRANSGNETCLAGLRKLLDERPEIWQAIGNVSALAEKSWIALIGNGNKLVEESIPRRRSLNHSKPAARISAPSFPPPTRQRLLRRPKRKLSTRSCAGPIQEMKRVWLVYVSCSTSGRKSGKRLATSVRWRRRAGLP